MAFPPPSGLNTTRSVVNPSPIPVMNPGMILRPFSPEGVDAQLRDLGDRMRSRVSYSPPSTTTTTTTTATTSTTTTTTAIQNQIHLPPLQRFILPPAGNDAMRPQMVNHVRPPRQEAERLPHFNDHFQNIAEAPNRAAQPLPMLAPLKDHNLSPEEQLGLFYYDQLIAQSEYDTAVPRREELIQAIDSLNSLGVISNQLVVNDYLNLLELKVAYNYLGIEKGFIDFNKQIKEKHLKDALGYLLQADKTLTFTIDNAKLYRYKFSRFSDSGEYSGENELPMESHDIFVRKSIIFLLQSFCCLKINKMAATRDDVCGMHVAYPLYQKSRYIINRLSTVNHRDVQIIFAQMNANLAILNYEIACRLHDGSCYAHAQRNLSTSL